MPAHHSSSPRSDERSKPEAAAAAKWTARMPVLRLRSPGGGSLRLVVLPSLAPA